MIIKIIWQYNLSTTHNKKYYIKNGLIHENIVNTIDIIIEMIVCRNDIPIYVRNIIGTNINITIPNTIKYVLSLV